MKQQDHELAPDKISELSSCEIFVFGSNPIGLHDGGAARIACEKFGAEQGVGEGPTGRCYAIPTMGLSLRKIHAHIKRFTDYVMEHPMNRFLLTRIGCGYAGFSDSQMAPLFREAARLANVAVPRAWVPYLWPMRPDNEAERLKEIAGRAISTETLMELTRTFCYAIGAGLANRVPRIRIRFCADDGRFGYADLSDCFFLPQTGDLYVWRQDPAWEPFHEQRVVESVFGDECRGRGYARRVIFAGVETPYRDSHYHDIHTGDVFTISRGEAKITLALSVDESAYCFLLGDERIALADCAARGLKLDCAGTVFYRLNPGEMPVSVEQRAMAFNNPADSNQEHARKMLLARYTPRFEQAKWYCHAHDLFQ